MRVVDEDFGNVMQKMEEVLAQVKLVEEMVLRQILDLITLVVDHRQQVVKVG